MSVRLGSHAYTARELLPIPAPFPGRGGGVISTEKHWGDLSVWVSVFLAGLCIHQALVSAGLVSLPAGS